MDERSPPKLVYFGVFANHETRDAPPRGTRSRGPAHGAGSGQSPFLLKHLGTDYEKAWQRGPPPDCDPELLHEEGGKRPVRERQERGGFLLEPDRLGARHFLSFFSFYRGC